LNLQTYRAACREFYRVNFIVEQHDFSMKEYCAARDKGLLRIIQERGQQAGLFEVSEWTSLSLGEDPLVTAANEKIEPVRELVAHIQELRLQLEKTVFQADEAGVYTYALKIDLEIPVALAGAGTFVVNDNGVEKRVFLLINIVPCAGNTILIVGSLAHQKDYVNSYLQRWMVHALSILSMIESWMINGTDQWCLKPSVWNTLPIERQSALLSKLFSDEMNIGNDCGISIFDQIRKDIIDVSNGFNAENLTSEYLAFIESEQRKIY
jgi:hypothetical protein